MSGFEVIEGAVAPIKAWTRGVPIEHAAVDQLRNIASLPFIHSHVAVMPDVHLGKGATVGSVIATKGAIVPAAVGVDIGCGMMAVRTSLTASDLPDSLERVRSNIERAVPHGGPGPSGGWGPATHGIPNSVMNAWISSGLEARFKLLCQKYPKIESANHLVHLGTLGGGNHFIEICVDEDQRVWVMLHSGSRGVGNLIGRIFIEKARELLVRRNVHLPDRDLAWLEEGEPEFDDYREAVAWAQDFARVNREMMMLRVLQALRESGLPAFRTDKEAVNCHHNYVQLERHFGEDVWLTRKGAVSAQKGQLGIIPGSMGAKSFIVRGKGAPDSFCSCSHGAGRKMSRSEAKRTFTVEDHEAATAGIECRKDAGVIDETPLAYKDIDAVMAAQADLVEVVHTLKQVVCVKG
jgi:tRNA-splicing ligase RtcB (3'-phosphate/5'-hydroxy nucleic acid ligase)